MKRALVAAFAALSLAHPLGAAAGPGLLPYVGTVDSLDAAARKLSLKGPDGQTRTWELAEELTLLSERGANPTLAQLAEMKDKPIAVFLRSAKIASGVSLLNEREEPPARGWLREVLRESQELRFETTDGDTLRVRPSVNLGASSEPGEKPGSADWAWFEKHIGKPFELRSVRVFGRSHLWSVSHWKPEEEDRSPASGGAAR